MFKFIFFTNHHLRTFNILNLKFIRPIAVTECKQGLEARAEVVTSRRIAMNVRIFSSDSAPIFRPGPGNAASSGQTPKVLRPQTDAPETLDFSVQDFKSFRTDQTQIIPNRFADAFGSLIDAIEHLPVINLDLGKERSGNTEELAVLAGNRILDEADKAVEGQSDNLHPEEVSILTN